MGAARVEAKTAERRRGPMQNTQLRFDKGKVVAISKLKRIEFDKVARARDRAGGRYDGLVSLPSLETAAGRTYVSSTGVAAVDFGRSFTEFPAGPIQFKVEFKEVAGGADAFARREELRGELLLDAPTMFNRKAYFDKLEASVVPGSGKPISPKVEPQVVQLPAKVEDMSVAGAGRFLVLYFGAVRKIGVFDLETRKLGAFVSLDEDRVMMAAGRDRVIAVGMESGKTHSWSLPNLKQVSAGRWPQGSVPKQLSMGSDASRAIGIARFQDQLGRERQGIIVVDGSSVGVQEIEVRLKADRSPQQQALMERFSPARVISSQSGNSFSALPSSGSTIAHCVIFGGSAQASLLSFGNSVSSVVPSNTGSLVFTSGEGIWDSSLERGYDFDILHMKTPFYLPSEHQNYFFSLSRAKGSSQYRPGYSPSGAKKEAALVFDGFIHDARTRRPVGILPDLSANLIKRERYTGTTNPMEQVHKRFILSPKHKTLVTFSQDLKRLELFPIGITPAAKWEHGVLQVKSNLHLEAKMGKRFEFKLQVDTSDPPLRYLPPQGTPTFKVTDDGRFSWDVPPDYDYSSLTRYLEIVDSKGRHLPFRVRIRTEK